VFWAEHDQLLKAKTRLRHQPRRINPLTAWLERFDPSETAFQETHRADPVPTLKMMKRNTDLQDALIKRAHWARLSTPKLFKHLMAGKVFTCIEERNTLTQLSGRQLIAG
jgi:hypothetical protein